MFTCNTCFLQFPTPEDQRAHMKSDWHRYNLKRRVANLPSINEDLFKEKVQKLTINEEQEDIAEKSKSGNNKQITKKEQRKREKEALLEKKRQILEIARKNMLKASSESPQPEIESKSESESTTAEQEPTTTEKQEEVPAPAQEESATTKITEAELETLTDDQLAERILAQKLANKVEIPLETCLFCNNTSFPTFEECITHMHKSHGFFIPEQKYLTDKEGLVQYMAEKIGLGNVCIGCNFQGRSIHAVRAHMVAKRHCCIPYDSENEKLEISEFYDFTSTYADADEVEGAWEDVEGEEEGDEDQEDEVLPEEVSYSDGVQLHLPSGLKIGHRSLARYFKQNLKPERVLSEGQGTVIAAESRHMMKIADRAALLETKRIWKSEKTDLDRNDRRAAKFINNQPHYRDQLLQ